MPRRTTPDPFAVRVGARIRELRDEFIMSPAQLADAAQISQGHLSSIERGLVGITTVTIVNIARGFGLPALYLLAFADEDRTAMAADLVRRLPLEKLRTLNRDLRKNAKARKSAR